MFGGTVGGWVWGGRFVTKGVLCASWPDFETHPARTRGPLWRLRWNVGELQLGSSEEKWMGPYVSFSVD